MKKRLYLMFFGMSLAVIAGCSSTQKTDTSRAELPQPTSEPSSGTPTPSSAGIVVDSQSPSTNIESVPAEPLPKPVMSGNRAVVALLDRAQIDVSSGKRDAAGASLERALRIEPRNPWLWHEMAQLRLIQGQYAQAITMAKKSNSFAGGQRRILGENWQVIGNARVALGDNSAADAAFKMAKELLQ